MCKLLNFVNFIICIATFSQTFDSSLSMKRGPHHPRSEQTKTKRVDQHLTHEEHRIEDDLKAMGINVNPEEMTEEEKNFYYFKKYLPNGGRTLVVNCKETVLKMSNFLRTLVHIFVCGSKMESPDHNVACFVPCTIYSSVAFRLATSIHDSDNNNALDGLEMLHAAIHQEENFKRVERDTFLENAREELNHIIEVIDEFLLIADANKDGFLHYPEYVNAVSAAAEPSLQ